MSTVMEKVSSGFTVKAQQEDCKISFNFLNIPFAVIKNYFYIETDT